MDQNTNYNQRLQKNNTDLDNLNHLIQELPVAKINQEKIITPTTEEQIIVPDDNTKTLSQITVNPIPAEYITTTDANATVNDIFKGQTAYVKGQKIIGIMEDGDASTAQYGREDPTLVFTPNRIEIKEGDTTSQTVIIETNSTGFLSVISENTNLISANLNEKILTVIPSGLGKNGDKTKINIFLAKNEQFRRKESFIDIAVIASN